MSNNATNFAAAMVENSAIFLDTTLFGITVTQYPLGRRELAAQWPANFVDSSLVDTSRGKEVVHTGEMLLASSVPVDVRDEWSVNGEIWQTLKTNDAEMGLQLLHLTRNEPQIRTASSPASKIIK